MATKRLKRPRDPVQLGKLVVDILTGQASDSAEDGKDPKAVERGRRGGIKGGEARAKSMTSQERSAAASKAVRARWSRSKKTSG